MPKGTKKYGGPRCVDCGCLFTFHYEEELSSHYVLVCDKCNRDCSSEALMHWTKEHEWIKK